MISETNLPSFFDIRTQNACEIIEPRTKDANIKDRTVKDEATPESKVFPLSKIRYIVANGNPAVIRATEKVIIP